MTSGPGLPLSLRWLEGRYAICRLPATDPLPGWANGPHLAAMIRTAREWTVVCEVDRVPAHVEANGPWAALEVLGVLNFRLTGILASLAVSLAEAEVSLFAVSTFETDYILVPFDQLERASRALGGAGHRVE